MAVSFFLVLIPLFLLGLFIIRFFSDVIESRILTEELHHLNQLKATVLDRQVEDVERLLAMLADDPDLRDVFVSEEKAARILRDWALMQTAFPERAWIYYGEIGENILVSPEWERPDGYRCEMRSWFYGALMSPEMVWIKPYEEYLTGRIVLTAAVRIMDERGNIAGVLAVDTFPDRLFTLLYDSIENTDCLLYAITAEGRVVDLIGSETSQALNVSNSLKVTQIGASDEPIGINGTSYYSCAVAAPKTGITLVSLVPKTAHGEEFARLLPALFWALIFGLVLALAGSTLFSVYIINNIQKLRAYMSAVENGHVVPPFAVSGSDEFLDLQIHLNRMVDFLNEEIAEHKRLNIDLNRALKEKDEYIAFRSAVLQVLGHSANAPVTYVYHISQEILEEKGDDPEAQRLHQAASDLKSLAGNIMAYFQVEQGHLEGSDRPVDISVLSRIIVRNYAVLAARKKQSLRLNCAEDVRVSGGGDFVIKSILDNLIDNAVKYSRPGGAIIVSCRAEQDAVVWEVRDSGPGFAEEDFPKLFSRFCRLSARPTGDEISTGLGLYLVGRLVDIAGAEIAVWNVDGGALVQCRFKPEVQAEGLSPGEVAAG